MTFGSCVAIIQKLLAAKRPRLISESAPVRSRQFLLEPRYPLKSPPSVTLYEMATGVVPQWGDWIITRSLRVRATQCRLATSAASIALVQACRRIKLALAHFRSRAYLIVMETIQVRALAASKAKGKLEPFEFSLGSLAADQVDIKVQYCGICHSDLSMLNNEFGFTQYPFVPGHEAVGVITAKGDHVPKLEVGQTVGLGWFSGSCMACSSCLAGDHNHCTSVEQTIVGRHGAYATHVRCHWVWATPIPQNVDHRSAGPLFCGGITVFNPIIQHDISPLARVGVIGIGGLGHLALQFLRHWGCEVYAFTSTDSKREEAVRLGAHQVINSRHDDELSKIRGALDMILVTVSVPLNWAAYFDCLAPKGVLHFVGVVPEPVSVIPITLILGQKSVSGTPLGSPSNTRRMIEFCARHQIAPVIEAFPMSRANEALEHLEAGKARYRIVLENDLT